METLEYRTIDKSAWPRGPWDNEPDKMQWQDEATGLPCLIVRGPSGALCGYVGVPEGHKWHGQDYDNCEPCPDVHGGLTFASACYHSDDPGQHVCHIPAPGEPDDVWWLGFDCAHIWDRSGMAWEAETGRSIAGSQDVYRDVAYVQREVAKLAVQVQGEGEKP